MVTVLERLKERWMVAAATAVFAGWRIYVMATTRMQYDDAFITYRYAKHLAAGAGFVYNAGEKVLGTTTPLFTLMLALFARIGIPPHIVGPVLGLAFELAAIGVIYGILMHGPRTSSRVATTNLTFALFVLLWAFDPLGYEVGGAGMEMPLVVLLTAAMYYALQRGRSAWAGVLGALAVLARIDAGLPAALVFLYFLVMKWRKRAQFNAMTTIAVGLAVLVPCLILLWLYFGSPIPNSVLAKRYYSTLFTEQWIKASEDLLKFQVPLLFFEFRMRRLETALFLWALVSPLFRKGKETAGVGLLLYPLIYYPLITYSGFITQRWYLYPALPFFLLGAAGGIMALREMTWREFAGIGVIYAGVTGFGLAVTQSALYHAFQFEPFSMVVQPLIEVAMGSGLLFASRSFRRPLLAWVAAVFLGVSLLTSVAGTLQSLRRYANGYLATNAEIGKWIAENRVGKTVALGEIGYVGYYSDTNVLDLVGLVQPEVLKIREQSGLTGVFEHFEPDLLVFETRNGGDPGGSEFAKSHLFQARYRAVKTWRVADTGPAALYVRELTLFEKIARETGETRPSP